MTLSKHLQDLSAFGIKLDESLTQIGMFSVCNNLLLDHICIRLNSIEAVDSLKQELLEIGHVISQATINGRDIFIIKLERPLVLGGWNIPAVELPYPKAGTTYADGWEHVEFVLNNAENTNDGIEQAFFTTFPHLSKEKLVKEHQFKVDEPTAEVDQLPNPTMAIKVNGVGIKFHAKSIEEVVGYKK